MNDFEILHGPGRLWCNFDATYLSPGLCQAVLHGKRVLVGGAWGPLEQEHCCLDMETLNVEVRSLKRASTMLEFLVYDPCAVVKTPFSMAAMPMDHSLGGSGNQGHKKAQWSMLHVVGQFLEQSRDLIRGVCFDAHQSHSLVRRLFHGQLEDVDLREVENVPFFREIQYVSLPEHCLPNLPLQIAMHHGDPVYAMCGPCPLPRLTKARDFIL